MESLYSRILLGLCEDFQEYNAPVVDTTTSCFQNQEMLTVGRRALNRKAHGNGILDAEWELHVKEETLRDVLEFLAKGESGQPVTFNDPTALLALVFCEGFFGTVPSKTYGEGRGKALFGELTDDSPPVVDAEHTLSQFLDMTDFKATVSAFDDRVSLVRRVLEQVRGMLLEDAFDKAAQLKRAGDNFVMRYNAGRNSLLRGLPRFLRVAGRHQG